MQTNVIRLVPDSELVLSNQASQVCQAVPQATGINAGVHRKEDGQGSQKGNGKQSYGLWHRCLPYKTKQFSSANEAYNYAVIYGYKFDGLLHKNIQ